ncbi:MAG: zinc finger domain-containing protein, partial [Actinobacteria bacterium]|nr:zinc finger domain-containing protein [Actinomycetota bacterium]
LMLFLILKRIRDSSESAIDQLKVSLRNLKIKDTPGKDVDTVVSYIKSAHLALVSASRPDRNFVPDDFVEMLYKIFQTSSVETFNRIFREEKEALYREGDRHGYTPKWPSYKTLLNQATNSYSRLKGEGVWDVPTKTKNPQGYNVTATPGQVPPGPRVRPPLKCFNCLKEGHLLHDCPEPANEARIAKNREAFFKNRPPRRFRPGNGKQPPQRRVRNGVHEVCNKKGVYVLDQKFKREQAENAKKPQLAAQAVLNALTPPAPTQSTQYVADADAIRSALNPFFNFSSS